MVPTVITDVSDDSAIMQEEVFGPVTCIVPFEEEAEVLVYEHSIQLVSLGVSSAIVFFVYPMQEIIF